MRIGWLELFNIISFFSGYPSALAEMTHRCFPNTYQGKR
jgi:hypothetical protein